MAGRGAKATRRVRREAMAGGAGALLLLLTGCGIPVDTEGTLDRVRGGELRVGITHNPPWTDTSAPGRMSGSEVELIEDFAAALDADVEWVEGSEGILADALHTGELDLAVGGFTDDTPWTDKAAVTAPYTEVRNDRGVTEKHVALTRAGENRLLVALEQFLRENGAAR